jgi:hypothetical protein
VCHQLLLVCCKSAADEARASLEAKVQEHIEKAKHAAVKEALRKTEDELHKLIAVPAVELLQSFPAHLWQQLHTVRLQVGGLSWQAEGQAACWGALALTAQHRPVNMLDWSDRVLAALRTPSHKCLLVDRALALLHVVCMHATALL